MLFRSIVRDALDRESRTVSDLVTILDEELYPGGLTTGYPDDAGIDLAVRVSSQQMHAYETYRAPLGVSVDVPKAHFGMIIPRSSTATSGIQVSPNVIDPGYTGEVHAWLTSSLPERYTRGKALVQLVIIPCLLAGAAPRYDEPRCDKTLGSSGARTDKETLT